MTESEYASYLENRISVWEIMAMTRFRVLSPSPEVQKLISQTLSQFKLNRSSVNEISSIYSKLVESKKYFDEIDVKSSDGGIVAIEFIVQTLTLAHLEKLADSLPRTILELIEKLKGLGALTDEDANQISETYDFYRTIEFANYTSLGKATHKIPHQRARACFTRIASRFQEPRRISRQPQVPNAPRGRSFFRKVISTLASTE